MPVKQLMKHIQGYTVISRLPHPDAQLRIYKVITPIKKVWIAWFDPQKVILPDSRKETKHAVIETGVSDVWIEPVMTAMGQSQPERTRLKTQSGNITLILTSNPVYVYPTQSGEWTRCPGLPR